MVFSLAVKALQHPELPADMYAMTPRDKAWLRTKYKPYTELASSAMLHSKRLPAHAEDAGGGSGPDDDAEDHGNTAEHMDQEGNHTSKCNDPKPSEGSKRKRHDSDAGGPQPRRSPRLQKLSSLNGTCRSLRSSMDVAHSASKDTDGEDRGLAAAQDSDHHRDWLADLPDLQPVDLALGIPVGHGAHVVLKGRLQDQDVAVKFWEFFDDDFDSLPVFHRCNFVCMSCQYINGSTMQIRVSA